MLSQLHWWVVMLLLLLWAVELDVLMPVLVQAPRKEGVHRGAVWARAVKPGWLNVRYRQHKQQRQPRCCCVQLQALGALLLSWPCVCSRLTTTASSSRRRSRVQLLLLLLQVTSPAAVPVNTAAAEVAAGWQHCSSSKTVASCWGGYRRSCAPLLKAGSSCSMTLKQPAAVAGAVPSRRS